MNGTRTYAGCEPLLFFYAVTKLSLVGKQVFILCFEAHASASERPAQKVRSMQKKRRMVQHSDEAGRGLPSEAAYKRQKFEFLTHMIRISECQKHEFYRIYIRFQLLNCCKDTKCVIA